MIGFVTQAIIDELQFLFDSNKITVLYLNNLRNKNFASYGMPLIILKRVQSPGFQQKIGGAMSEEWNFSISVYDYEPNEELQPDDGYSTGLMEIVKKVADHFAYGTWLAQSFQDLYDNYSFRMILTGGISDAQILESDTGGICTGFEINYETVAYNTDTCFTKFSDKTLDIVTGTYNIAN
jgi:hypothetical protein